MSKNVRNQVQLISQAINTANNALNLAKQLLRELEVISSGGMGEGKGSGRTDNVPGVVGKYDGENMVADNGDKYPVPQNYASKSGLVYGDTLKRIEQNGNAVFKQIQRVRRQKVAGVLVKKEGKWALVTSEGSYKVLDRSVDFYGAKEGDEAFGLIPEGSKGVSFAALEMPKKGDFAKGETTIATEGGGEGKLEGGKQKSGAKLGQPKSDKKEVREKKEKAAVAKKAPAKKSVPSRPKEEEPKEEAPVAPTALEDDDLR